MSPTCLDQYRELCQDCRNREAHAWVVPGGAFVWTATLLSSMEGTSGLTKVLLCFLNALVFSSLLLLFYRWAQYQKAAQEEIRTLLDKPQFSDFVRSSQYFGLSGMSSTRYLIAVMIVILVLDVICLGASIYSALPSP